jgi:hypothetical protein
LGGYPEIIIHFPLILGMFIITIFFLKIKITFKNIYTLKNTIFNGDLFD